MSAQKFTTQGCVIDSETRQGLANIEVVTLGINPAPIGVNATVTDTKNNPFRRTITDEDGDFTLRFTDLDVINYFNGRPSNLFFKPYRDRFLIENTRETRREACLIQPNMKFLF